MTLGIFMYSQTKILIEQMAHKNSIMFDQLTNTLTLYPVQDVLTVESSYTRLSLSSFAESS